MDRKMWDTALPMLFALLIVICSLWIKDAVVPVAIVGGILLGIYYAAVRPSMIRNSGEGRERHRDR